MKIGFIGQGYIGGSYANDLEKRGYNVIRYSKNKYYHNKDFIRDCDIVFIAIPTPSVNGIFDGSLIKEAVNIISDSAIIVIKSTVIPGFSKSLANEFPEKNILFSPEFLLEKTAEYDAANPIMNIIGTTTSTLKNKKDADIVMKILPKSNYNLICSSDEAEIFKYLHNIHGVFRIALINIMFNISQYTGVVSWDSILNMSKHDPYMNILANYYDNPIHKEGRGAGGNCFVKDLAAISSFYKQNIQDSGFDLLKNLEKFNSELLVRSKKDLHIVNNVYGTSF